jgi:hypothetical protein
MAASKNVKKTDDTQTVFGANHKVVGNIAAPKTAAGCAPAALLPPANEPGVRTPLSPKDWYGHIRELDERYANDFSARLDGIIDLSKTHYLEVEELDQEAWDARFGATTQVDRIPEGVDIHNVWSANTGDDGDSLWLSNGNHPVNHAYYLISEEPWTDDDEILVCLDDGIWSEDYCRDCGEDVHNDLLTNDGFCAACSEDDEED